MTGGGGGGGGMRIQSVSVSVSVFLGWAVLVLSTQESKTANATATATAQRHGVCATDVQCLNEGKCQLVDHAESADVDADDADVDGNIDDADVDGSNVQHRHCVCLSDFGGPRCEKFCPLNCLNGGYCRFLNGAASKGSAQNYHEHHFDTTGDGDGDNVKVNPNPNANPSRNPIDYNCECFGYFTGTFCEIPYENCSDGRRCFHGGSCIAASAAAGENNQKTACDCPEGFEGGSCAIDLSVSRIGLSGSSSSSAESNRSRSRGAGPIVAGVLVPLIVAAFLYAAFVYRNRRRTYSTLEFDAAELVPPRGSSAAAGPSNSNSNSGRRQQEWRNII